MKIKPGAPSLPASLSEPKRTEIDFSLPAELPAPSATHLSAAELFMAHPSFPGHFPLRVKEAILELSMQAFLRGIYGGK